MNENIQRALENMKKLHPDERETNINALSYERKNNEWYIATDDPIVAMRILKDGIKPISVETDRLIFKVSLKQLRKGWLK